MAGEVVHVVYGARILSYLKDKVKGPSYWTGTLFPDIRHLGIVSRHHTHPKDVSLESLVGEDDFHTGIRVHAWVDSTREKFLSDRNMKETLPWHPFVPHAIKLLEDELVYDKYNDWNLIHRSLNTVLSEEIYYVNSEQYIRQWHTILQNYFRSKPNDESRKELSVAIGLSENSAIEVNNVIHTLAKNKQATQLIDDFAVYLESLLT